MNGYFFGEFNPTAIIYDGFFTLNNGTNTLKIKGTIVNSFSYIYEIKFTGEIIDDIYNNILNSQLLGKYTLQAGNFVGEGYLYRICGNIVFGKILREIQYELKEMNKLTFSLVNLIPIGDKVIEEERRTYLGFSSLLFDDWSIELEKKIDYKQIYEELETHKGFANTHIGKLTNKNNENFTYKDAKVILNKLYSYLSFICGRRIFPCEIKGYNNLELVFSSYENKLIDTWSTLNTWYPKNKKEIFPELFQNFSLLWEREPWKRSKNLLLGTYFECFSHVTLENRITNIQIALELISKLYLVDDMKELSNRKFKGKDTTEKLEHLFISMGINLDSLFDYIKRKNLDTDNPVEFLVKVRNSIVHPKKKVMLSYENLSCAYHIGIWMLEMCVLRLLNYSGRYNNRLSKNKWHGDVENGGSYYNVPWLKL
ncbi:MULTISPECIES: hypothetical protein [Ornithinibacillus]|uniref:hypothetical protein n=1 Tax=Ornithinibacillus TaxID=484508 RepID=UPI00064D84C8|nr:hypothetical protein [Ornithinibacillus contaminans]